MFLLDACTYGGGSGWSVQWSVQNMVLSLLAKVFVKIPVRKKYVNMEL
jgi:hypothetical protein